MYSRSPALVTATPTTPHMPAMLNTRDAPPGALPAHQYYSPGYLSQFYGRYPYPPQYYNNPFSPQNPNTPDQYIPQRWAPSPYGGYPQAQQPMTKTPSPPIMVPGRQSPASKNRQPLEDLTTQEDNPPRPFTSQPTRKSAAIIIKRPDGKALDGSAFKATHSNEEGGVASRGRREKSSRELNDRETMLQELKKFAASFKSHTP